MTERPIIFSAPMVRAILEGRKTQTRRALKPKRGTTIADAVRTGESVGVAYTLEVPRDKLSVPYAPGDLMWVREACFAESSPDGDGVTYPADRSWKIIDYTKEATLKWLDLFYYRRDTNDGYDGSAGKLVPPIHMPRWASRITLRVTDVRVQRLQEISEEDAKAEGVSLMDWERKDVPEEGADNHVECFSWLWESIHGPSSWDANPWVAAITFERVT